MKSGGMDEQTVGRSQKQGNAHNTLGVVFCKRSRLKCCGVRATRSGRQKERITKSGIASQADGGHPLIFTAALQRLMIKESAWL